MDKSEKKYLREEISQHFDLSGVRLSDDDALLLQSFICNFASKFKNLVVHSLKSYDGWSSDGKFTRTEEKTAQFDDDMSLRRTERYWDDDGQHGEYTDVTQNARTIVNFLKSLH